MTATFVHGKSGKFTWNSVDLSTDIDKIGFPRTVDEVETTTFSATAKTWLVGLSDNKITISGMWDTASSQVDPTLAPDFAAGTSRAWTYLPAGTGTTYSGNGYLTNYTVEQGVNDAVKFKAEVRITGAVGRA